MNCIIIDDNELAIRTLSTLISNFCPQVNIFGTSQSIEGGVKLINELKPDLVFLDVEIKTELSFDLFSYFSQPEFSVIFTTAHEKYALKAIQNNCFGYLLKPIETAELVKLVSAFGKNYEINKNATVSNQQSKRIAFIVNNEYLFINENDILYLNADGKYTDVITSDGKVHKSSKNIGEIELLLPSNFFKCHKSSIVNMNHIIKFIKDDLKIILKDNTELDLAARRKEEFLKLFSRI
jgi:two-component system, LytTR family, response regulator